MPRRVCAQAVRAISEAYERDPNGLRRRPGEGNENDPLHSLVVFAGWMNADKASRLCEEVIQTPLKKSEPIHPTIIASLPQLDTAITNELARELVLLVCSDKNLAVNEEIKIHTDIADFGAKPVGVNELINKILTDVGRPRHVNPYSMATQETQSPPSKPWPCRLTTQELVELLKMPTCFGQARRVVLDHLGNIHGRRFTNHWEFVRFAREKGLQLDLTTPPRRPNRQESIKRMLAILDGKS